ncbi:MAG: hypothetical protein ACRET4_16650 [Steroidobacteraceae bacterium]
MVYSNGTPERPAPAIAPEDSFISVGLISGGTGPIKVFGQGLTMIPNTTVILECGGDPISTSATIGSNWLSFDATTPFTGGELSDDGQTLRGTKTFVQPVSGLKTVVEWDLHAEQQ